MASNPPQVNVNAVLSGIAGTVSSLIKPLEELAAYFGVVGIGVANEPNLPIVIRAVLAAFGALHIVGPKIAAAHKPDPPQVTVNTSSVPTPQA